MLIDMDTKINDPESSHVTQPCQVFWVTVDVQSLQDHPVLMLLPLAVLGVRASNIHSKSGHLRHSIQVKPTMQPCWSDVSHQAFVYTFTVMLGQINAVAS